MTLYRGVLVVMGLAALAMVFGSFALAADDTRDKMFGPSMEIKKESIEKSSHGLRNDDIVPELTKEFEGR